MADSPRVRRDKYVSAEGLTVVLEVPEPPMGNQSGYIPPPTIDFWRNGVTVQFGYQGDERG